MKRTKHCFEIEQDVEYRTWQGYTPAQGGRGRTVNISSDGVYFTVEGGNAPASGMRIELVIRRPVLLHGCCPMKLMIYGRVESSDCRGAAVSLERYEFRTRGDS